MIGHQTIGGAHPLKATARLRQNVEEIFAIRVVEVDVLAAIAARRQVIQRAGEFDAQRSGHARSLRGGYSNFKT
jgi:hypothetical protein